MSPTTIKNFSSIIDRYDSVLLDLWGVVHDGTAVYPGAKECFEHMKQMGKKVVMVSNAPRRAAKAQLVLDQLGIDRTWYQGIYTSGEVAYQYMQQGAFSGFERYLFIGPERDVDVLDGLGKQKVESLKEADFLLNVGFGSEQDEVAHVSDLLSQAKDLELPMLCLNPDLHVVKITGERYECAGVIAKEYESFGGIVHYFGKPYPHIYDTAYAHLGKPDKDKILMAGDGLNTDIRGAVSFGIDSLLITGGILQGSEVIEFEEKNTPNYIAPSWAW